MKEYESSEWRQLTMHENVGKFNELLHLRVHDGVIELSRIRAAAPTHFVPVHDVRQHPCLSADSENMLRSN
jgi:hypothetical protein